MIISCDFKHDLFSILRNVSSSRTIVDNRVFPFAGIPESGDELLSMLEIDIALRSIGYLANTHPGYEPRLVGEYSLNNLRKNVIKYLIII